MIEGTSKSVCRQSMRRAADRSVGVSARLKRQRRASGQRVWMGCRHRPPRRPEHGPRSDPAATAPTVCGRNVAVPGVTGSPPQACQTPGHPGASFLGFCTFVGVRSWQEAKLSQRRRSGRVGGVRPSSFTLYAPNQETWPTEGAAMLVWGASSGKGNPLVLPRPLGWSVLCMLPLRRD